MHGQSAPRLLRRPQVEERTGLSRSTIYRMIEEGTFPGPLHLGSRIAVWPESVINEWINEQLSEYNPKYRPSKR